MDVLPVAVVSADSDSDDMERRAGGGGGMTRPRDWRLGFVFVLRCVKAFEEQRPQCPMCFRKRQ
ncbi:hypothetical protein BGY98DRAFT_965510 [Russula aff. rugulosa BPL654]|nr:hypothetical protein BGY98DRAFT_965510 [Russula aff. rugulosa BPL654]